MAAREEGKHLPRLAGDDGMITSPIVAVVTPFDAQGAVDSGALQDYLALLSAAGVKTILVNGTTG
jgi:dihydrodipicolinate synthase/N-acetylneuraminate lyase